MAKSKLYVYKRLFQYVRCYKRKIILVIALGLVGVGFEVAKPLPVKIIMDNVLSGHPLPSLLNKVFGNVAFLHDKHLLLLACILSLLVIALVSVFLTLVVFNLTIRLSHQLVSDLMLDFYSKAQRLSLSFYAKNQVGDLLQRISGDVFVVYFLVAQIILPLIISSVSLVVMFYVMAKIDIVLALVAFSIVPLLIGAVAYFAKPMDAATMQQFKTQGLISAFLQQSLSSVKIVQAFGRESYMEQKLKQQAQSYGNAFVIANRTSMKFNQCSALITATVAAVLVGLGAYRALNGILSIGDIFVFLGYTTALYGPVTSLSTAAGAAVAIGARGKRIFEVLDSDEVIKEKNTAVKLEGAKGAVEFRNVSFGYGKQVKDAQPVLSCISFAVTPGQTVAIVGPTGTGKTSIVSLLCRFYDPWEGRVSIDDVDIADLQLHSLRGNISLVLQEPFIFPMSIAENIAFGNPFASFEEIVEAAKGAQAHDFICALPEGYETVVAEGGASLSGGEKQRIAIARAFLKTAPVLILDEPTSAIDALTESKIFRALKQFAKGKTVFLISHRLSTIKHADVILTMKDGRIVEQGTHEHLLKQESFYADLYKHQHIA